MNYIKLLCIGLLISGSIESFQAGTKNLAEKPSAAPVEEGYNESTSKARIERLWYANNYDSHKKAAIDYVESSIPKDDPGKEQCEFWVKRWPLEINGDSEFFNIDFTILQLQGIRYRAKSRDPQSKKNLNEDERIKYMKQYSCPKAAINAFLASLPEGSLAKTECKSLVKSEGILIDFDDKSRTEKYKIDVSIGYLQDTRDKANKKEDGILNSDKKAVLSPNELNKLIQPSSN